MFAYALDVFVVDAGMKPFAIGASPLLGVRRYPNKYVVMGNQRIVPYAQIRMDARPSVTFRAIDHGCTSRIEFDVSIHRQKVLIYAAS